jgi:hypothetical protein
MLLYPVFKRYSYGFELQKATGCGRTNRFHNLAFCQGIDDAISIERIGRLVQVSTDRVSTLQLCQHFLGLSLSHLLFSFVNLRDSH